VPSCATLATIGAIGDAGEVDEPRHELAPVSIRHVLLPLDGSGFALAAMPTAQALAERFGAELLTISVAIDERRAERLRRHALESLGDHAGEERVQVVVSDDAAAAITGHAAEVGPCVVCMSTRGRGRLIGTMIGSVARAVLQSSLTPVIAVGPQADRPPALVGRPPRRPSSWPEPLSVGRIVACVDGSPAAEAVLPVAARWAAALEMRLSILTVAEEAATTVGGARPNRLGPRDPGEYVERLAQRWSGIVPDGAIGEVGFTPTSVSSGLRRYLGGHPAGLVALTTHARTGLDRIRLGATAADIVRTSTAPALVVPVIDL
jgi:nucleotide-binding universal stress UspA family protein